MKYKIIMFLFMFTVLLFSNIKSAKHDFPVLKGPYLGQKTPGDTPQVFAPGIVCTDLDEYGCTFSPDGRQFYFTRTFLNPRKHVIMVSILKKKGWDVPKKISFTENHSQGEPQFTPDGKKLFFGRLEKGADDKLMPFIWVANHSKGQLEEPKRLMAGMYATASLNGNLYYTDVSQGMDKGDIVVSHFKGGTYLPAKVLGSGLNSSNQDAHPFIAPDESYIIFDSNRPGGLGNNDLYICYRKKDGSWGKVINLGAPINTNKYDAIPSISPDDKYLFFYRSGNIYWVNAGIINRLDPKKLK